MEARRMSAKQRQEFEKARAAKEIKEVLDRLNTQAYIDVQALVALERIKKYRAHIRAGFTEAQSLELCTK